MYSVTLRRCFLHCCHLGFVIRPDVKQKRLADFLDWNLSTLSQASDQTMEGTVVVDGMLQSLVTLQPQTLH
ncbi:UNVERIFIED_CONTAM: hypothetical protein FKN15_028062 [Acipenser sinensis]